MGIFRFVSSFDLMLWKDQGSLWIGTSPGVSEGVASSDILLKVVLDVAFSCSCFDIGRCSAATWGRQFVGLGSVSLTSR